MTIYWLIVWGAGFAFMLSGPYLLEAGTDRWSTRPGADARLGDIAARPDLWLRRLQRRSHGKAHGTVYRALAEADTYELETHAELCRQLGKNISPMYALRLLKDRDGTRRFWVDTYRVGEPAAQTVYAAAT